MNTNNLPEIIKSQSDALDFCQWLAEHEDIEHLQGFEVVRGEYETEYTDGHKERHLWLIGFKYGEASRDMYRPDMKWLISERRMLNDWIRTDRKNQENQ